MSSAINHTPSKSFRGLCRRAAGLAGEAQDHARAAALQRREVKLAAVLLDDLLDDREAQAGAFLARRHVGLEDTLAALRQAHAVVADGHRQALGVGTYLDRDAAAVFR